MEVEEYARIAAAEDDHWWYRNTRAVMADFLAPWLGRDQLLLDAGCGPGGNGAWMAAHGRVVGIDVSADALRFVKARRPGIVPTRANLAQLPFADEMFDIVVEITVLSAVQDDASSMRELARVLKPGGAVLLFEPAFERLRRAHDVTVHCLRRYRRDVLAALASGAGLRVRRSTYAYSFLAPAAAVLHVVERDARNGPTHDHGSDVERRSLDRVFAPLAAAERRWLARRDVSVGTSVAVLATKD
jgi:ubiquinone/menaquinone biosynthesis C-methylase UbiE